MEPSGHRYDLAAHGIQPARREDLPTVLLLHDDEYALRLWRRVIVEGFGPRVTLVESIEAAPPRVSVVLCGAWDQALRSDDPHSVPALATKSHGAKDVVHPSVLISPSAFEAGARLAELLSRQHGREFVCSLDDVDERPSVLIVDDAPAMLRIARRRLGRIRPYLRIECAEGGRAAIEAIERSAPDVVHLDDLMPDVYGVDVARALRASSRCADAAVVFHTSYGTKLWVGALAKMEPFAIISLPGAGAAWTRTTVAALVLRGYDVTPPYGPAERDQLLYLAPEVPDAFIFGA